MYIATYFYNNVIYKTIISKIKSDTGRIIEGYKKDVAIKCDIQPIEEKSMKSTWGIDIDAQYQVYSDEIFDVGNILILNDRTYEVVKNIDWVDYSLVAIKLVDLKVTE